MRSREANLYRVDDVLLRAGVVATLGVLIAAGGVALAGQAAGIEAPGNPALDALARRGRVLLLAALCPAALLWAGVVLRRRERRTLALWRLLRQSGVVSVPQLLASSDFTRADLERAVRLLNNRGLGHYVQDRRADTIQDGRLGATGVSVEKCESCGAGVGLAIPIGSVEIPRCPYCHDPVCSESLDERRREALAALRAEERSATRDEARLAPAPFSLGLFLALLICCWPAALVYAFHKWQGGRSA